MSVNEMSKLEEEIGRIDDLFAFIDQASSDEIEMVLGLFVKARIKAGQMIRLFRSGLSVEDIEKLFE